MSNRREPTLEEVNEAMAILKNIPRGLREDVYEGRNWTELHYKQPDGLVNKIQEYFAWKNRMQLPGAVVNVNEAGRLMEQIALLLFRGFMGIEDIASFQSYAAQHDLVVRGLPSDAWQNLMDSFNLPRENRFIIIEAKNQTQKINDQQFTRLCSILQNKFELTAHLGVFVSQTKAKGFPDQRRRRSLESARATQILFHAKTKKIVVVIDDADLQLILNGEKFINILRTKVLEVEASSGRDYSYDGEWDEVDLPNHLRPLWERPDRVR